MIRYEGQAAVELEQRADLGETGSLPAAVRGRGRCCGSRAGELIRAVVEDLGRGAPAGVVAARFHRGLAAGVVSACRACGRSGG